jgi:hypothetical protein
VLSTQIVYCPKRWTKIKVEMEEKFKTLSSLYLKLLWKYVHQNDNFHIWRFKDAIVRLWVGLRRTYSCVDCYRMYTATVNHIQSLSSQIYIYTFFTIQRRWSDKKMKKGIWSATKVAFKGNFSGRHFGHVRIRFFSLDLGFVKQYG